MMKLCRFRLPLLLCTVTFILAPAGSDTQQAHRQTLVVGWHDEFNSRQGWSPWTAFGGSDILSARHGSLRVTLGKTSDYLKAYGHYHAGVYRDFDVDLNRYPALAVRAPRFQNGSSWDVAVLEYREPNAPDARDVSHGGGIPLPGNPQGVAADQVGSSGSRYRAETVLVDVQPNPRRKPGKSHVRLMLNVSGPQQGAFVDFAWARFITREEVEGVRHNPASHHIRLLER